MNVSARRSTAEAEEYRTARLFGERIAYRTFGNGGPVIVLVHGMGSSGRSWDDVLPYLRSYSVADRMTLVIPDLLGYGNSSCPKGDYSPATQANVLRDLLDELGHDKVTVVGHSLGGAIAIQFAYQYRARCEGLVLVASGGLGHEVAGILRTASLPGSGPLLNMFASSAQFRRRLGTRGGRLGSWLASHRSLERDNIWDSLTAPDARAAFLATLRAVVDASGQRMSALPRLPQSGQLPTLFVWGDQDPTIPVRHAYEAQNQVAGSELVIFSGAKHAPHRQDPERFANLVRDFVRRTQRGGYLHPVARSEATAA